MGQCGGLGDKSGVSHSTQWLPDPIPKPTKMSIP